VFIYGEEEGSDGSKSQTPMERLGSNRKNRKDSRRPSHGPQKGTKVDLDAISECLRTAVIIEELTGMKIASENGDFGVTKVR
jgi:hypothetical protein